MEAIRHDVKRQMREEIGEQELNKAQSFALLEKYGFVAPRIDRNVTMPIWMERWEATQEEKPWKRRFKQWKEMTRGMVFVPEKLTKFRKPISEGGNQRTSNPATKFESRSTENGKQGRFSRQNRDRRNSSARPQTSQRDGLKPQPRLPNRLQPYQPYRTNPSHSNNSEN